MKVIQHSSVLLILQEQLLGIWLIGLCTALVGFFIFISFEPPMDLFGGFCIAIASLMLALSPTETCTFDKTMNRVTVQKQYWFSQQIKRYPITQIAAVEIEEHSFVNTPFYRVRLRLKSGQQFPVIRSASTDRHSQQTVALRIRTFLDPNKVNSR